MLRILLNRKTTWFRLYVRLLFTLVIILVSSCTVHDEQSQETERWTSADPLAIPQRVRQQKHDQGNLVFNPSFESGKILLADSLSSIANIDGWTLIGNSVTWVRPSSDTSLFDSSEVYSGARSIRIQRKNAGETETFGHGVLSDYIKVIPGNYQLSFRINLKDIANPKSRLGMRLYDAVDIEVVCYDRNRIKIDRDFAAPGYNTIIDNFFKSLSFSSFSGVDSSGWLHVIGKSHLFPFPDGDLQDETKFVRIFLGLKGNGTMWLDDVSFTYTRWNFSMLERLSPYFDSTLVKSNLIIPRPREVEILESLIYYRPYYKDYFPVILIPENCDSLTL